MKVFVLMKHRYCDYCNVYSESWPVAVYLEEKDIPEPLGDENKIFLRGSSTEDEGHEFVYYTTKEFELKTN